MRNNDMLGWLDGAGVDLKHCGGICCARKIL